MHSTGGSRSALERLPAELKQAIFKAALMDNKDDVRITLAADETSPECGAFNILEKLNHSCLQAATSSIYSAVIPSTGSHRISDPDQTRVSSMFHVTRSH
ncbi:hypothetical protein K505DRAFT_323791 [Melanomma pulvis-pyrius CBS 109.77]|uniref:Uncharacterized protein n=1 Tax=Melanomma pulvis-pyrius CBS 109.77 TaxID=1314802 RepID=A0A6A6XHC8_9PLEO|nr:hypothetical protein K505DRAFT_323791 [Melanomma pulvis-pyrius CBS 109.77]